MANLSNPETRAAMQRDLDDPAPKVFSKRMQDVFVSIVRQDRHRELVGKNLVEIGRMQGKTPLEAMLDLAIAAKVAFVPGAPFYANEPETNTFRLSFVTVPPERIREGIGTLGQLIKAQLAA